MKRALKAMAWVSGLLLLGSGLVFGIWAGINAFDEDLSPQARQLLAEAAPALKDEDNAYFALWGMTAAEGADPHAVGKRVAAGVIAKLAGSESAAPGTAYDGEIKKLKPSPAIAKLCDWAKEDCYARLAAAVDRADPLAQENATLLARYAALGRYKGYSDTAPRRVATPFPPFQDASNLATLDLLVAIAEVKRGDAAAGLKRIGSGITTARMYLASSEQLLPRMIFANILHRHAVVVAGLAVEFPDAAAAEQAQLAKWLAPLTAPERSVAPAFSSEFQVMHNVFASLTKDSRAWDLFGGETSVPQWIQMRFLQPNASANLLAAIMTDEQRLTALPADKLVAEFPALEQRRAARRASNEGFSVRNPVGRMLVELASVDYTQYALRMHDLDAHLRLAALAAEIGARRLEPGAIAGYVTAASAPAVDPYTGKPFKWDAEKRELSTSSQAKGQRHARGGRFVARL